MTTTAEAFAPARAERAPRERPDVAAAKAFLRSALTEASGPTAVTVLAPLAPATFLMRAVRKAPIWVIEGTSTSVAIGEVASAPLDPREPDGEARALLESTLRSLPHAVQPGAPDRAPRAMIGAAFARSTGRDARVPWDAFGDGRIVLPRWSYVADGGIGSLTFVTNGQLSAPRAELAEVEVEHLFSALERPRPAASVGSIVRLEDPGAGAHRARVDAIRRLIAAGSVLKIVTARHVEVTCARDLEAADVLDRLALSCPTTTRYAVRAGREVFVGATPEHLFRKSAALASTEAIAGSIAPDVPDAGAVLLASAKDREEHAYVVEHLAARLAPLASRVVHPDRPGLRALPNVVHLRTPVDAELRAGVSALDLLAALHPTPATAGWPVDAALAWLAEHEAPRGWYAGPLGWADARGDAEMVVALRCALLSGARAWVYGGGGIVHASDARAELAEAELKMRPLLAALGAGVS